MQAREKQHTPMSEAFVALFCIYDTQRFDFILSQQGA